MAGGGMPVWQVPDELQFQVQLLASIFITPGVPYSASPPSISAAPKDVVIGEIPVPAVPLRSRRRARRKECLRNEEQPSPPAVSALLDTCNRQRSPAGHWSNLSSTGSQTQEEVVAEDLASPSELAVLACSVADPLLSAALPRTTDCFELRRQAGASASSSVSEQLSVMVTKTLRRKPQGAAPRPVPRR